AAEPAVEQLTPMLLNLQAPAPSQVPAQRSEPGNVPLQLPRGSAPDGTSEQAPSDPVTLQLRQVPLQALSQQTPSTQKPLPQSVSSVQTAPFGFLPVVHLGPAAPKPGAPPQAPASCPASAAAGTLTQAPRAPGTLQPWQVPGQPPLQQ